MSHWNPSSSGWPHRPDPDPDAGETGPIAPVTEQPDEAGEPAAQHGGSGAQPGWGAGYPSSAPPMDPDQYPTSVDPYEQPPIWSGPQGMPAAPPMWEDQQPPVAYLRQQPEPPGAGRGSRAAVAAVIVLLVLLAGGAVIVYEVRSHNGTAHAAPTSQPAGSHAQGSPQGTPQASRTATPSPSPSPAPRRSAVAIAPGAAADPAAPAVARFLASYFGDINAHSYRAFRSLLNAPMQQVETAQKFSTGFRSTTDSDATLVGLSPAPDGRLAATVTFTSHQAPADSPDQSACTHWTITLYLEQAGGSYLIGAPPAGYRAAHQAC